ncbi:hypothetical protein AB3662_19235 [Sorangium cellulosum]|uniref:hypothetical protein n=1 Tax=Sorangium cellulosum TaxID=56 RepID=UPI003D9A9C7B
MRSNFDGITALFLFRIGEHRRPARGRARASSVVRRVERVAQETDAVGALYRGRMALSG